MALPTDGVAGLGRVEHFLITRFHVRINDGTPLPPMEWVEARVDLFERYCLPSVAAQTNSDFTWLVFIDEMSPDRVRDYLEAKLPVNAEIVAVSGVCEKEVVASQVAARVSGAERILTSRVDSDDSLHPRYIEDVQREALDRAFAFLNFADGYQYSRRRLLRYGHPSNAFISLVEPAAEPPLTVFCDWHDRLSKHGPVVQLKGVRRWVQSCHGSNAVNQERGIRVSSSRAPELTWLDTEDERWYSFLADVIACYLRAMLAVVRRPARIARVFGR
ncbi:hypothetical protein CEP17_12335 [Microbacterium sp. PM5]|nr:hypothetical protein CEP17_12335 [Microbacterium sp. PM5]